MKADQAGDEYDYLEDVKGEASIQEELDKSLYELLKKEYVHNSLHPAIQLARVASMKGRSVLRLLRHLDVLCTHTRSLHRSRSRILLCLPPSHGRHAYGERRHLYLHL